MIYKEDWERARDRLNAWWEGEVLDRVVLQVFARRNGAVKDHAWDGWNLVHNLDTPERAIEQFEDYCRTTYFGGEAFPDLWVNYGPGVAAAFLGAEPRIDESTVWFETPRSWGELSERVRLDPCNEWWRRVSNVTRMAVEAGPGKWITGMTDLGGSLDIVASLRGAQQLVFDLIECPENVQDLSVRLNKLWFDYYNGLDAFIQGQGGTTAWMGIWCAKRWYPLQCDFSAMISPAMFEEFVVPYLAEQCRRLDHSIYHWDGPGQIPHLDLLLDIPELDGIQWTPGSGEEGLGSPKWFPLYRRIQERGKRLVLLGIEPRDIPRLMDEVSPKGLLLSTGVASEEEAKDLLRQAPSWTRPC